MKTIRGAWRFFRVVSYAIVCVFVAYTKFKKSNKVERGRMLRLYPTKVLELAGVRCSYEGSLSPELRDCGLSAEPPGILVVSNHISWLDIFSLDSQIPSRFIAKAEIAKWPIFGLIAKAIGTLFIDRSNKRAILRINDDVAGALRSQETVALFAEGTTTFGNELLPVKTNFLAPAVETNATVIPVVLCYKCHGKPTKKAAFAGDVSLFGSLWNVVTLEDAEVVVHFLEPVRDTMNMTRQEIGKVCEERMNKKLKEIWGSQYVENDPNASLALEKAIKPN